MELVSAFVSGTCSVPLGRGGTRWHERRAFVLVRRLAAGQAGTDWDTATTAHNPEVEGSNPSPATKLTRDFAPHLLSGVGGVARFGSRIGSIAAGRAHGND